MNDNITGTLGSQICAYWRAALSDSVNDTWSQYGSESVANRTMILQSDDFVGESSLESAMVNVVSPYLFSYCDKHAENEEYKIILAGRWLLLYVAIHGKHINIKNKQ